MSLLAIAQQILRLLIRGSEPTLTELLSDSAVKAVMKADGVDPLMLEAELRAMATKLSLARRTHRKLPQVQP